MSSSIQTAVEHLRAGRLVALPTETVYGLGADARNADAIRKIFLAKQRPFTHPLIVHVARFELLADWAYVPEAALRLAEQFWPGPLTLILKKRPEVLDLVTGNQDTVGLRIPAHPLALELLEAFGSGIAAPSANRYTRLSPTSAQAVREELGASVDYVLDGGACEVGIESTILDLSNASPMILRPGMISAEQIEKVLGVKLMAASPMAPRAPGQDLVHYSPETKLQLIEPEGIRDFVKSLTTKDLPLAILVRNKPTLEEAQVQWIVMSENPQGYAHELYGTLRELDKQGFKRIVVEEVPDTSNWDAIRNRLVKAAGV